MNEARMTQTRPFTSPSRQHGAAALVVTLLMLFGITLVAFFANRSMIFEQRTSANQYRSTRAFEAAEAGLEWAIARLNDDKKMVAAPSCSTTGVLAQSFGERYLTLNAGGFTALGTTGVRSGCSISATTGATTCSCPGTTADLALGAASDARFSVELVKVAGDDFAVRIYSYGCTNQGTFCEPSVAATTPDAVAVVSAIYKMKPAFPNAPGAGLVTGSSAVTSGSLNVHNTDVLSNGITINSGSTVELGGGTSVTTLAGSPPRASVLDNDTSLAELTAADGTGDIFFASFFGETMAEYKNNPKTFLITSGACTGNDRCTQCTTAASCGAAVSSAIDKGYGKFWTDTDASWTSANLPTVGTLGEAGKPIMVASTASLEIKGSITAYGMLYAATAGAETWDYEGSGTAKVFGAFVSRGSFLKGGSGNLDLIYDANVFKPANIRGLMVRVPGSWRDTLADYN
jgi:Tfp pilus assembly protein PilX